MFVPLVYAIQSVINVIAENHHQYNNLKKMIKCTLTSRSLHFDGVFIWVAVVGKLEATCCAVHFELQDSWRIIVHVEMTGV